MKSLVEKFNHKLTSDEAKLVVQLVEIAIMIVCAICVIVMTLRANQIKTMMEEHRLNRGNFDNIEALMLEIQDIYNKQYVGEHPNPEDLEDMALAGFTAGYGDSYGAYLSPTNAEDLANERKEQLVGIGVQIVYEGEVGFYVIQTYRGSSANEVGIREGDYIISAGDVNCEDNTHDEMIEAIRGEEGTTVELGIRRGDEEFKVTVERMDIKSESVRVKEVDDVGYIKVDQFTEHSSEEFIEYLEDFKSKGIDKFIIDLRNNSGGMADTVINMIDYLIPEGLIVEFKCKDSSRDEEYYSDKFQFNGDIVVLINNNSASASELFSKALQDYGRAKIIGMKSYGKGTICTTYGLSNGGSLILSTGKYHTISGDEIEGVGVTPDIEVKMKYADQKILYKLAFEDDIQFKAAYKELTGREYN